MKKKVFIGIGVFVVLLIGVLFYMRSATKKHSPAAVTSHNQDGFNININYCQPFKKGRVIFGPAETGALQPYGKYWRMGANEATTFSTETALVINGKDLPAGKYAMYAIPQQNFWTIAFNTENDRWGATAPSEKNDVLRVDVPVTETNVFTEQFTITFETDSMALNAVMSWDNASIRLPIKLGVK
jgi:hypothetical protein